MGKKVISGAEKQIPIQSGKKYIGSGNFVNGSAAHDNYLQLILFIRIVLTKTSQYIGETKDFKIKEEKKRQSGSINMVTNRYNNRKPIDTKEKKLCAEKITTIQGHHYRM